MSVFVAYGDFSVASAPIGDIPTVSASYTLPSLAADAYLNSVLLSGSSLQGVAARSVVNYVTLHIDSIINVNGFSIGSESNGIGVFWQPIITTQLPSTVYDNAAIAAYAICQTPDLSEPAPVISGAWVAIDADDSGVWGGINTVQGSQLAYNSYAIAALPICDTPILIDPTSTPPGTWDDAVAFDRINGDEWAIAAMPICAIPSALPSLGRYPAIIWQNVNAQSGIPSAWTPVFT